MKKKHILLPLVLICFAFFFSCEGEKFDPLVQKRTYLHFLNMYDGASSIDIYMKAFETNGIFASGIDFVEGWPSGGYASLLTNVSTDTTEAEAEVSIRVTAHSTLRELIPENDLRLNPGIRSTISLIDSFGKAKLVKTIDIFEEIPDSVSNIRFMNINYRNLSVSLQSSDKSILIDRLNFLNYSSFNQYRPGTYDFQFVDDVTGFPISELKGVEIKPGKTYSFFLTQKGSNDIGGYETLEFVEDKE